MTTIDQTEFYLIEDALFVCCDEHQFQYRCKRHDEMMGCQFCEFNPYSACDCSE